MLHWYHNSFSRSALRFLRYLSRTWEWIHHRWTRQSFFNFFFFFSHLSQARNRTLLLTWVTFCFSNKSTVTKPYSCCTPKAITKLLNQPIFSICSTKETNKAFSILYRLSRSRCGCVPCRVVFTLFTSHGLGNRSMTTFATISLSSDCSWLPDRLAKRAYSYCWAV